MIVDLLIVICAVSALWRGRQIGFAQQACSTLGFFGGLLIGTRLGSYTVNLGHTQTSRGLITLVTTLGCGLLLLTFGEYIGLLIKKKVVLRRINILDNWFGSILGVASFLFTAWLIATVVNTLPFPSLQSSLQNSRIVSSLNRVLPSAPNVIADIGRLIDPNGFPQVFVGKEPRPDATATLPSLKTLQAAINHDQASVVKVEGQGCGGIVEGSGFVVGSDLVATNAHVVAGIAHPYAIDSAGTHSATVVWFDPNLDFAVLRVDNLAGQSLVLSASDVKTGTPAAVLGYPGGGPLTAESAAVLNHFTATGRNIYDRGSTNRDVYEIQANIIPGNSGGPLIATDGTVIGVIFAESTTTDHVGYALTTQQVTNAISQAVIQNKPVDTGQCAE
ncbi:MAG: MarP family serine protease [Candidatus Saccharimonadales bacterium]